MIEGDRVGSCCYAQSEVSLMNNSLMPEILGFEKSLVIGLLLIGGGRFLTTRGS